MPKTPTRRIQELFESNSEVILEAACLYKKHGKLAFDAILAFCADPFAPYARDVLHCDVRDFEAETSPLLSNMVTQETKDKWAVTLRIRKPKILKIDTIRTLYLMVSATTGLIKIGISSKPKVRERTLQGEDPFISILATKPGKGTDEKILHSRFSHRRVRGEWFRLTDEDLEELMAEFQQSEAA